MTQTSNEVIKLFKSRINILELQKTRGFNTEPYDGFNLSEVNTMHSSDQMDMLLDNENSVMIFAHLCTNTSEEF